MKTISKPKAREFPSYASMYIDLLPDDGLVLQHLQTNLTMVNELILPLSEEKITSRFAEGEWTIKEILGHVIDTERIYSYRSLRFARNDTTRLPGFEQDDYVADAGANKRPIASLLEEYTAVRGATISLFAGLDEAAFTRSGVASKRVMSVRAAIYIIAGHELHHVNSIRENYLM